MHGKLLPMVLLSVPCLVVLPAAQASAQMTPYQQHAMQVAAYQRQLQMAAQQQAWQMAAMQNAQRVAAMQHAANLLVQQQAAYFQQMTMQARQASPQLAAQQAAMQIGGKKIVSAGQVPINVLQITPQDRALALQMNQQLSSMIRLTEKENAIYGSVSSANMPGFATWEKAYAGWTTMTGYAPYSGQHVTGFFNLGRAYAGGGGVCDASSSGDGSGGDGGGCGGGGDGDGD
jgi:hypothetical protein